MSEQNNLFIAVALSIAILVGFNYFYDRPKQLEVQQVAQNAHAPNTSAAQTNDKADVASQKQNNTREVVELDQAIKQTQNRIIIDTPKVHGSINLEGARIDDLRLANYHEIPDVNSPEIRLLAPTNTQKFTLKELMLLTSFIL
jgi:YidC/Oxa1 family membrane protein insertase